MRFPFVLTAGAFLTLTPAFAAENSAAAAWRRFNARAAQTLLEAQRSPAVIPPAPDGVTELSFKDFFSPVIGDRGLDLSTTLRSLHSRRVRIAGYMTRDSVRHPGMFMLTAFPTTIESGAYCFSDDLPPAVLYVLLAPGREQEPAPYVPGLLLLTGTLDVGPQPAADGRNSFARLILDPTPVTTAAIP